jgi:hypothetical protein
MSTTYGVTTLGFVAKPQSEIITELNTAFQAVFGQNINLGPESVFGQIIGIFSEREALIWELGQAIYASQYPAGAEGTSVDNILALNNLQRLQATATVTNPLPAVQTNGITLYGLVLFGTPGTVVPQGSTIQTTATPPLTFTLDSTVTIGSAANAVQSVFFSNVPTTGSFGLTMEDPETNELATELIPWNAEAVASQYSFASTPSTGNYTLTLTQAGAALTTGSLGYNASASAVQSAIQALAGYSAVTVSGSYTAGFVIAWGNICQPILTVGSNTTSVTITPIDSVQAAFNNLLDSNTSLYPYTDVRVGSLNTFSTGFIFTFGAGTTIGSNPSSGDQQQALLIVTPASNTLQNGSTVTNISISTTTMGTPAQGTGSATCTVTGPNFVAQNTLAVIGSPVSGWSSVNNQLDCITGTNTEDDTQAIVRRATLLAEQANGPLQSIIEKVREIAGVTQAIGFENINSAALQQISFSTVPNSGAFTLSILTQSGTILTTASIPYTALSSNVQTAIRNLTGYGDTLVTGSFVSGFTVDFNGSFGGQPQNLFSNPSNTLETSSSPVTITIAFGRPGHSFEIVVSGGLEATIAQTIYSAKPAGIQAYGSTVVPVTDNFGNTYQIGFSRPTEVLIYVVLSMTTDLTTAQNPQFSPGSVGTIQQDLITIGNAVPIGGLIVGFGSNGLIGAFNSVPGILSYTLYFGRSPGPGSNANIQLAPEEVATFESTNITVSYT